MGYKVIKLNTISPLRKRIAEVEAELRADGRVFDKWCTDEKQSDNKYHLRIDDEVLPYLTTQEISLIENYHFE